LERPASSAAPFAENPAETPRAGFSSRACHDLAGLRAALGRYDAVLLGPVFRSISKIGYGPSGAIALDELYQLLRKRTLRERSTEVIALGGLTEKTAPRCRNFGFDGVASLGTIWQSRDPVRAFLEMQSALAYHAT
jgi:thiamine-phosphate pyrophosphorylase